MQTEEQIRAELLSRGAIEIKDGSGSGFQDDPLEQELDPALEQELAEIQDRINNCNRSSNEFVEKLAEVREENIESVKSHRFSDQEILAEYCEGTLMGMAEFLHRFQKICPTAFYNECSLAGRIGLNYWNCASPKYITSVQFGQSTEFSQLRIDAHKLPTNERYRGWRTVLMAAIRKGIVTEEDVEKEFGPPTGSPDRNSLWYRDLYRFRNRQTGGRFDS